MPNEQRGGPSKFANDPERASEAGKKGDERSHGGQQNQGGVPKASRAQTSPMILRRQARLVGKTATLNRSLVSRVEFFCVCVIVALKTTCCPDGWFLKQLLIVP